MISSMYQNQFWGHLPTVWYISSRFGIAGNSLALQWLGFWAFTAVGPGLILGSGTKILQAVRHSLKKKKKKIWNNDFLSSELPSVCTRRLCGHISKYN